MEDYRFLVTHLDTPRTTLFSLMQPHEALLLYANSLNKVIGRQLIGGETEPFFSDIPLGSYNVMPLGLIIEERPDGPLQKTHNYAIQQNKEQEYFKIVSIIAKCALKLQYKQLKKAIFSNAELQFDTDDEPVWYINPHMYEIDNLRFLNHKFVCELRKDEKITAFFREIRNIFLTDEFTTRYFFEEVLKVGEFLSHVTSLQIVYQDN